MKRAILALAALSLLATPLWAELSQQYKDWPSGPEGVLLTPAERTAYQALTNDEQAQHFIDLFWAKRDPNLNTRVNEFRVDFEARVAAADKQFADPDGTRGALTDRGKVLILLGMPGHAWTESIQSFQAKGWDQDPTHWRGQPTPGVATLDRAHGEAFNEPVGVADVWVYGRDQVPATIELPKRTESLTFAFFDEKNEKHFVMQRAAREARWGLKVLDEMPAQLIKHPELTEMPTYPLLPGSAAATAAQLTWLTAPHAPDGAETVVTQGVATAKVLPAWIFVELPAGTAPADLMIGRLTAADGTVAGTFQQAAKPVTAKQGLIYEVALPAAPGDSTLELALAAAGTPLAVFKLPVHLDDVAADATWISPFFAGAELQRLASYDAGTPFVFGGYHLILRPDAHYAAGENLEYFALVVRPGVGEDGKPKARLRVRVKHGSEGGSFPAREIQLSEVAPDVYMAGSEFPLDFLKEGGDWTLKMTLEDQVSGVSRTTDIPVVLPEKKK